MTNSKTERVGIGREKEREKGREGEESKKRPSFKSLYSTFTTTYNSSKLKIGKELYLPDIGTLI